MRNITRHYVTKKANIFTRHKLRKFLDLGLLDKDIPRHLEAKNNSILAIYGLLCCNEILKLTTNNVTHALQLAGEDNPWEVQYPYATKTNSEVFAFMIPGKYKDSFVIYISQLKNNTCNKRFLKNWHTSAKKHVQNLGIKKVKLMPKMWAKLVQRPAAKIRDFTNQSFR